VVQDRDKIETFSFLFNQMFLRPRWDWDDLQNMSWDHLKTETLRPRLYPCHDVGDDYMLYYITIIHKCCSDDIL